MYINILTKKKLCERYFSISRYLLWSDLKVKLLKNWPEKFCACYNLVHIYFIKWEQLAVHAHYVKHVHWSPTGTWWCMNYVPRTMKTLVHVKWGWKIISTWPSFSAGMLPQCELPRISSRALLDFFAAVLYFFSICFLFYTHK